MTLGSMSMVPQTVLSVDDEASLLEPLARIDRSVCKQRKHEEKILEADAQVIAPRKGD